MVFHINNSRKDVTHPTAVAYLAKVLPYKNFETEFVTPHGTIDYIAQIKNGKLFIYEVKTADDKRGLDYFIKQMRRYTKYITEKFSKSWEAYLVGTDKMLDSVEKRIEIVEALPNSFGLAMLDFSKKRNGLPSFVRLYKSAGYKAISDKEKLKRMLKNSWKQPFSLKEIKELKEAYSRELQNL